MTKMTVTLNYFINKTEAIKHGRTQWGEQTIDISPADCPVDCLDELAIASENPQQQLNNTQLFFYIKHETWKEKCTAPYNRLLLDPINENNVFEILRERQEIRFNAEQSEYKKQEETKEKNRQEYLESIAWFHDKITAEPDFFYEIINNNSLYFYKNLLRREIKLEDLPDSTIDKITEIETKKAEKELTERLNNENKQREKKERDQKRTDLRQTALDDAISTLADDTDKQRYLDDSMTDQDRSQYIKWLFDDIERYQKLT